MTRIVSGTTANPDLYKAVIIDDGNGQLAVLTTTVLPTPSSWSVGAFDQLTTSDVLTTPTQTTYSQQVVNDQEVLTSEDVTVVISPAAETQTVNETVTTSEAVTVYPRGYSPALFSDAVATSESTTLALV
jgi:hypothetical protein